MAGGGREGRENTMSQGRAQESRLASAAVVTAKHGNS